VCKSNHEESKIKPIKRCSWCTADPLYIKYHDQEWGVPIFDDRKLFEFLILEGAQAGLNWITILKKREGYRKAFADFDPLKVSTFSKKKKEKLLLNSEIIRNRLKIDSAVKNAQAFLKIQKEYGSFSTYQWGFIDGVAIKNKWKTSKQIPTQTIISEKFSHDLKQRGFNFVGPTIMYAYMQAVGMINDHVTYCFRYNQV